MEIIQPAFDVDAFEQQLNPESFAADGLYGACIALADRIHDAVDLQGRFLAQLGQPHIGLFVGRIAVRVFVQPVVHDHGELRRVVGIGGHERVEYAVVRDYREVRFALEPPHGSLHAHDVLRSVGLAGNQVGATQIDVFDGRGKEDMHGFVEGYFDAVRCNRLTARNDFLYVLCAYGRCAEREKTD